MGKDWQLLKSWLAASCIAGLGMLGAGCVFPRPGTAGSAAGMALPAAIAKVGELRVGLIPDRPPYVWPDPADAIGFAGLEMKLLKALATQAGLPLRPRAYANEAELFAALRGGEIDLAVPAASDWTVVRYFHAPCARHLATGQRYLVRREAAAFLTNLEQLDRPGIIVLTVVRTAAAELAGSLLPQARQETFVDLATALQQLAVTTGAVLLIDARTAWALAGDQPNNLAMVFGVYGQEQLAWAVRDAEADLAWQQYLDQFMAEVQTSGRLAAWLEETDCHALHAESGPPGA